MAPEALDEHRQWRSDGDRLAAQARNLLEDQGEDGRHLSAMEGVRSGLESSLSRIETVQTIDDLARFKRGWTGIVLNASKTSVPEIHVPGYRDVAEIGKRLAGAKGLNDSQDQMITDWQKADRLQGELTARIESLPNDAAALVERTRSNFSEASGSAENVPNAAWKNQCETLIAECRAMLDPDSTHTPHLDAMASARDWIGEAGSLLEKALLDTEIASFNGLARAVQGWAEETGGLEIDAPDYPELMRQAGTLDERNGVPAKDRETIREWMDADAQAGLERLRVGALVKGIGALDREWQRMDTPAGENGETESGTAAVSDAWQAEAELALREVRELADDFSPATLDAHARAVARRANAWPGKSGRSGSALPKTARCANMPYGRVDSMCFLRTRSSCRTTSLVPDAGPGGNGERPLSHGAGTSWADQANPVLLCFPGKGFRGQWDQRDRTDAAGARTPGVPAAR